ncbi:MAG: hypothetical protein HYS27_27850 [Deltaproteobacteria bacterium]|nr:hypothetical protein [Deltaproteobacteria bacterium]
MLRGQRRSAIVVAAALTAACVGRSGDAPLDGPDGGGVEDAGNPTDAGEPADAGLVDDAGTVAPDAGMPAPDGGTAGGPSVEIGPDVVVDIDVSDQVRATVSPDVVQIDWIILESPNNSSFEPGQITLFSRYETLPLAFDVRGTFRLRVVVADALGRVATDEVTVRVRGFVNTAPLPFALDDADLARDRASLVLLHDRATVTVLDIDRGFAFDVDLTAPANAVAVDDYTGSLVAAGPSGIEQRSLSNGELTDITATPFSLGDVDARDGIAFVTAEGQGQRDVGVLELGTGVLVLAAGTSEYGRAVAGPGGRWFYSVSQNVDRFDLTGGELTEVDFGLGTVQPCLRLWVGPDAAVDGCGVVRTVSANRTVDLTYLRRLPDRALEFAVSAADFDPDGGRLVVGFGTYNVGIETAATLHIYSGSFLESMDYLEIPRAAQEERYPRFVFFDAGGDRIIVLAAPFSDLGGGAPGAATVHVLQAPPRHPPVEYFPVSFATVGQELPWDVADVDHGTGRFAVGSRAPRQAAMVDPVTHEATVVDLPVAPTTISLAPDGNRVAVGGDGDVFVLDSSDGSLVAHVPVATVVDDVTFFGDGMLLVGGRDWEALRFINLGTGDVQLTAETTAPIRARLHPGGTRVYAAAHGGSPEWVRRYVIQGEALVQQAQRQQYTGDDLWLFRSIPAAVVASRAVLNVSTDVNDMNFIRNLESISGVLDVDEDPGHGRFLVVPARTDRTGTDIVDGVLLFPLPPTAAAPIYQAVADVMVDGAPTPVVARYAMFSDDGNTVHALVHPASDVDDPYSHTAIGTRWFLVDVGTP